MTSRFVASYPQMADAFAPVETSTRIMFGGRSWVDIHYEAEEAEEAAAAAAAGACI